MGMESKQPNVSRVVINLLEDIYLFLNQLLRAVINYEN